MRWVRSSGVNSTIYRFSDIFAPPVKEIPAEGYKEKHFNLVDVEH
jgi:hypothetical protein